MTKRYTIEDNIAIVDNESIPPNGIYTKIFVAQDPVEAIKICKELNEQAQKIKELEQQLFAERVKRFEDNLAEYGDLGDKEAWQRKFGMSRREANKKAGIIDWELIPE